MINTDRTVTIVFGPGRRRFQKITLKASGRPSTVNLQKGKFGIITSDDNNTYTVERYKIQTNEKRTIKLKFEEGRTVAYLVNSTGQEERLEPEMMEYRRENEKTSLEK